MISLGIHVTYVIHKVHLFNAINLSSNLDEWEKFWPEILAGL